MENPGQEGVQKFIGEHYLDHGFSREPPDPGRSWRQSELEIKSYEDLRKIWFTLLIERNQLKSCELYFQHQTETLGDFPHPTRLDRIELSMMRIKEVMRERHIVSTRVAWKEFLRRVGERYYRYPAGPHAPAGYRDPRREVVFYARSRVLKDQVADEAVVPTKEERVESICDHFGLVFNTEVFDATEELTPEGSERAERRDFLSGQLQKVSRALLPASEDLLAAWRAERDELQEPGPWRYTITVADQATAEAIIERAREEEDQVMRLSLMPQSVFPAYDGFDDDDHLWVDPELPPPKEPTEEMYQHILAREEWRQRRMTRPAAARPQEFAKRPSGIDPLSKTRRDLPNSNATKWFEVTGSRRTQYIDAPHKGTTVISGFNRQGVEQ